ncbi:MAG: hypothetical protein ABFD86_02275, partial [Bryobacteraceae bacterium]
MRLIAVLLYALAAVAAEPVLSPEDTAFLHEQARKIVASAHLAAGASSGKWRNATPYAVHVPGGNMGYPAFWVRDAVMMLGADFVPPEEVEGWIRLMASTIRNERWDVHPGAVVPAYAVADHINFDGRATFYPGTYNSGTKQGGKPYGKYPPLDDHFYFITAVYEHWKLTRSTALFRSKVGIAGGELGLAELCERVYAVARSDEASGLVIAGDVETENAKDWGFGDTVFKSGKLLFPSVLKHNAAKQLAELFAATGDQIKARRYDGEARRLRKAITNTFRRGDGWLRSATEVGDQPDVWGTAFAVWSGAVNGSAARNASCALANAYRARTAVRDGLVRHVLTDDVTNHGLWQKCAAQPETYQNGGYWSTPTGWYIAAVQQTNPSAARAMAREFVGFLRGHMRPDGMSQAWEWVNPDTGKRNNPLYVASVAL